ncbi:MAG: cytochrome c1 [Pseudomonadota bacterium]
MKRHLLLSLSLALALGGSPAALAAGDAPKIERSQWTFSGITGQFDEAQLQRGFAVYRQVCASCHSMKRVAFRNLAEPGGPNFPRDQVQALAAEYEVSGGVDDDGEPVTRPARLSDTFPTIYPNDKAARAANGGALPPDLSLIAKARGVPHPEGVLTHTLTMARDVLTGYQEGGADYLKALLTSYKDPPEGVEEKDGLYYNAAYPGNWIAMAAPLYDDLGLYGENPPVPETIDQYATDVAAFLQWAADPSHDQRKQTGWLALIYLLITAALLYITKRAVWKKVKH